MPAVLKIDADSIERVEGFLFQVETKIRKDDLDINPGTAGFVWSDYSKPTAKDGQLISLGVVTRSERSSDRKSTSLTVALSPVPPLRDWRTSELDALKNRDDDSPETEIADEVRGFTHNHVGHVSEASAALMASYFI